ncbi:MAG: tetratricopeptide repeat protein, partial [Planctomycetota bacterium]|nr:tetratricopeptide repeat protein [Planctomycetota bacterium]
AKWYRKAAEQGDSMAQFNLGLMYYNGRGVPQDNTEAAKWYRKAAEQGHANAQCNLGLMYKNGQGATQDLVESYKFLKLAADQNNGVAITILLEIRKRMTETEIAEGKRRCAEFKAAH